MTLLKEREMVFKVFESKILLLPTEKYYFEQSEQSEKSNDYYSYILQESNITCVSNSASLNDNLSDLDGLLCAAKNLGKGIKLLIPKYLLQRFPKGLAQIKLGSKSAN